MNLLKAKPNRVHCEDFFECQHSVNWCPPVEDVNLNKPTSKPRYDLWWLAMFSRKEDSVETKKELTDTTRQTGDSNSTVKSRGVQCDSDVSADMNMLYTKITEYSHRPIQDKATQKAIRRFDKLKLGKPERQFKTSKPHVDTETE